jgi:hypothetical protein
MRQGSMQVCIQFNVKEVQTLQTPAGLKEIRMAYEPVWVIMKQADVDASPVDSSPEIPVIGGWKLCARVHDRAIGQGQASQCADVSSQIPNDALRKKIDTGWETTKFGIKHDKLTWQSYFMRWFLGL